MRRRTDTVNSMKLENSRSKELIEIRSRQRLAIWRSVARGFGAGLLIGLVLSVAVASFTPFQPALLTSLISILTAGVYGAYLGLIYGSQPGYNDLEPLPVPVDST